MKKDLYKYKGTPRFLHCSFESGGFYADRDFLKYFLQVSFFLVLTSRTCFRFNDFQILHIHKKLR